MPQTISARTAATVTCAANDLVTMTMSGSGEDALYIINQGPGKVWFSFDSTVPAAAAGANCFGLITGQSLTIPRIRRGSTNVFTLMADTAATIVTMICLPTA